MRYMFLASDEKRKKIVEMLFYIALTIELILMIVEKSEIYFPYESYVFRVTFLLTLLAVLIMKHDKKEWIVIAIVTVFTFFCYRYSGKNDLLRLSFFLFAARDIDIEKAMKYSFFVSLAGFVTIFLLSVFGVVGDVYNIMDYGRGIEQEKRYVFGFGHPNTLFGCVYALLLMWLWIYGRTAKWWEYALAIAVSAPFIYLTYSRTGQFICIMTLAMAVIVRIFPKLAEKKATYILGAIFGPVLCILLTLAGALITSLVYVDNADSYMHDFLTDYYWPLEGKLNYRMSNLYYSSEDRGGILFNWELFADRDNVSYFDMGWARIFYWYGIIPATLIILCVLLVIYVCWKKRDVWSLIMIISLSVYTLVESTYVTNYLGRDFYLLIAGVYLGSLLKNAPKKKEA